MVTISGHEFARVCVCVCRIVPQALCTRFGLAIGYYCSPIVIVLLVISFPITFPISLLLDLILGKGHGTFFRRAGRWVGPGPGGRGGLCRVSTVEPLLS